MGVRFSEDVFEGIEDGEEHTLSVTGTVEFDIPMPPHPNVEIIQEHLKGLLRESILRQLSLYDRGHEAKSSDVAIHSGDFEVDQAFSLSEDFRDEMLDPLLQGELAFSGEVFLRSFAHPDGRSVVAANREQLADIILQAVFKDFTKNIEYWVKQTLPRSQNLPYIVH